ncbi:MAG: hypothetical protein IKC01_08615 [Clostridia bacterium]|nr:hypothetical protein [Clostridia bacterium]
MPGSIILFLVSFGCGIFFFSIGVYAKKLQKPMWFWSGSEVKASQITDVKKYNRENGIMWQLYSLWFFSAGLANFLNAFFSVALLVLGCTAGIVILVFSYNRILKKYKVN